jgi:hypothetical protein
MKAHWALDRESGEYDFHAHFLPKGCAVWLTPCGKTRAGNTLYTVTVRGPKGTAQPRRRKHDYYAGSWTIQAAKQKGRMLANPYYLQQWGLWEPRPKEDEYNAEALAQGWY